MFVSSAVLLYKVTFKPPTDLILRDELSTNWKTMRIRDLQKQKRIELTFFRSSADCLVAVHPCYYLRSSRCWSKRPRRLDLGGGRRIAANAGKGNDDCVVAIYSKSVVISRVVPLSFDSGLLRWILACCRTIDGLGSLKAGFGHCTPLVGFGPGPFFCLALVVRFSIPFFFFFFLFFYFLFFFSVFFFFSFFIFICQIWKKNEKIEKMFKFENCRTLRNVQTKNCSNKKLFECKIIQFWNFEICSK
jgi:hypothetical protein